MTLFLQLISFVILIAAALGWGHWVWESNRTIETPEKLSQIIVHGVAESETSGLAEAVAIGIIGRIAEHGRNVAFINDASSSSVNPYDIQALTRISQPAPSLLEASGQPKALDIAIEFAGSKVETKGLLSLLNADSKEKGALSIALLLEKKNDKFVGLASSSFATNNAYGFAIPVEGNAQEIAEKVAMRFVQAHYAEDDFFYSALAPQDFQSLWKIRKISAEIAIKSSSGGEKIDSSFQSIQMEAREAYDSIKHLVRRYTKRPELQKLGAYLSSVGEDYKQSVMHLSYLSDSINNEDEKNKIKTMMAALNTDAQSVVNLAASTSLQRSEPSSYQEVTQLEASILSDAQIKAVGAGELSTLVQRESSSRKIDLVLVLGAFNQLAPFGDRVAPLMEQDHDMNDSLLSHTESVASVIASLAPSTNIKVVKAIGGDGTGSESKILDAINRAIEAHPEIIVVPLGPLTSNVKNALAQASKDSLVFVAGGNRRENMEHEKVHGIVYVGAELNGKLTNYSNYGKGIDIYAPGSVTTFDNSGKLTKMSGTSYSVAIASAVAANLASLEKSRIKPDNLEKKLLHQSESSEIGQILKVSHEKLTSG